MCNFFHFCLKIERPPCPSQHFAFVQPFIRPGSDITVILHSGVQHVYKEPLVSMLSAEYEPELEIPSDSLSMLHLMGAFMGVLVRQALRT